MKKALILFSIMIGSAAFSQGEDLSLVKSIDRNPILESSLKTINSYKFIVKFSDSSVHSNLIMTPETKEIQKGNNNNELERLNVSSSINRDYGLDILDSIYNNTGILLVHKRSLSLGYDLFLVKTNLQDIESVEEALIATGYFDSVKADVKMKVNNVTFEANATNPLGTKVKPASLGKLRISPAI